MQISQQLIDAEAELLIELEEWADENGFALYNDMRMEDLVSWANEHDSWLNLEHRRYLESIHFDWSHQ